MKKTSQKSQDLLTIILALVYSLVLVWILIFKMGVNFSYMSNRRVNLIPFQDFFKYGIIDRIEVILNVIVFIPAGFYAALLFRRLYFITNSILILFFSLGIELTQYVFRLGTFDVTDILNNTLGGISGLMFYIFISRIFGSNLKTQKLLNYLLLISTFLAITLLVLLKLNKLPIRYH